MKIQKMKNKPLRIFIVVCLVGIMILMGFMISEFSKIKSEGTACISSPFVWGAQKVAESGEDLSCNCLSSTGTTVTFNKEKMEIKGSYYNPFGSEE